MQRLTLAATSRLDLSCCCQFSRRLPPLCLLLFFSLSNRLTTYLLSLNLNFSVFSLLRLCESMVIKCIYYILQIKSKRTPFSSLCSSVYQQKRLVLFQGGYQIIDYTFSILQLRVTGYPQKMTSQRQPSEEFIQSFFGSNSLLYM